MSQNKQNQEARRKLYLEDTATTKRHRICLFCPYPIWVALDILSNFVTPPERTLRVRYHRQVSLTKMFSSNVGRIYI